MQKPLFWGAILGALLHCDSAGAQPSGDTDTKEEGQTFIKASAFAAADKPKPDSGGALFEALPSEITGIDLRVPIDTDHPDERLYYSAMACGSVAAGDLDGDGRVDLFFACGAVPNRLYRQTGKDFVFEDLTKEAGVGATRVWATGAVLVDIDNDGDLDIYVTCYDDPNLLYVNESVPGQMKFREQAGRFGLDLVDACLAANFADYDHDGDLDVFMVMNAYYRKGGRPEEKIPMQRTESGWRTVPPWDRYYAVVSVDPQTGMPKYGEVGRRNRLLRNHGGKFLDASVEAGIILQPAYTNSSAWWDYDGDGWLDLYVGNDFANRDEFYRNNGDGTFREQAADAFQHTTWFSMGAAAEDLNNDGRVDFLSTDMLPTSHFRRQATMGDMEESFAQMNRSGLPRQKRGNTLLVNTGTGLFLETAWMSGVSKTARAWTVKSGDFDGDGWIDLFFPTGQTRDFNHADFSTLSSRMTVGKNTWDFFESRPELRQRNAVFQNRGELLFKSSTKEWGLGRTETMSYGGTLADFDSDGDLDLVVMNLNDPPSVFRNRSADLEKGRFLSVELKGTQSNRQGLGSVVRVSLSDGTKLMRTLAPYNGFLESDEPCLHFGLGKSGEVASLSVEWPSGAKQIFDDIQANTRFRITEPARSNELPEAVDGPLSPWFTSTGSLSGAAVEEREFDDFLRQPLLPHKHSLMGPGQAWGDVDGDGFDDLYLGSPSGAPGRLLLSRGVDEKGRPKFGLRLQAPFDSAEFIDYEDQGVLFFDADGDGDEDLFVVSGSVEWNHGEGHFRDRLYLNDGLGEFEKAEESALPSLTSSGGAVVAADFDRDGDLDLFVAGRVVPGRYPIAARNVLLVNDGTGHFEDGTYRYANGLAYTGLVTAALWSDSNDDGWLDLFLTHEWGAIKLFRNRQGKMFDDVTDASALGGRLGLWNSISGSDFDGDGDIDYLVGNLGMNTDYHATREHPGVVLYGDFEGGGTRHIIEAKIDGQNGELVPRRGLSSLSRVMPSLLKVTPTFEQFAKSTVADLFAPNRVNEAFRLEINTVKSMALINDGNGKFDWLELPGLAQVAPVFGIAMGDFNADGYVDAVLAQNFYSPHQETGPMDGGLSVLLRGNRGNGKSQDLWRSVWPESSGVVIPGDAKSVGIGDMNGDFRPDLVFGINGRAPRLLLNENDVGAGNDTGNPLAIKLRGTRGNPKAIGAKVRLEVSGISPQSMEQTAGSGYLTQNSATLFFGLGDQEIDGLTVVAKVRWPDGTATRYEIDSFSLRRGVVTLSYD